MSQKKGAKRSLHFKKNGPKDNNLENIFKTHTEFLYPYCNSILTLIYR